MRRAVLWIIVIMTTFMIGIGFDRAVRTFVASQIPSPAEPKPVAIYLPEPASEVTQTIASTTPTAPDKPKPTFILDFNRDKFWPWADFQAIGPLPTTFEIDSIQVGINGFSTHPGFIGVDSTQDSHQSANAVFALVTERRLFFVTERMPDSEFEYRFDGEFLHTDFEGLAGTNTPVLRGILRKTKNGRTIAECTVSFRAERLGC